jgi:hypothetical protein
MSGEEMARFVRSLKDGGKRVPAVVEGRRYYQGITPPLAWAAGERLSGPHREHLPEPPSAAALEAARQQAFALLGEAEDMAAAAEAGSSEVRQYYIQALRRLNALSLRFSGDAGIRIARARAFNGLAGTLPPDQAVPAFGLAADLARETPESSLTLTQWGLALTGMARPEQGAKRDLLLSLAGEKLRRALAMNTGQASTAYALAVLAAEKGDRAGAREMLLKAARGESPVSGLHLATEEAFAKLRAAPWFADLTGTFPPPGPDQAYPPGKAAGWVARALERAKPLQGEFPPGSHLLMWARRLANTSGWEADSVRSALLYAEIHDLFSRAQAAASPPLTCDDYLYWGDALGGSAKTPCTAGIRPWLEEAAAAYRKALKLDPASLDAAQALLWSYGLLLSCPGDKETRDRLFETRNAALLEYAPADAADMLQVFRSWAYRLAEWAEESPAPLRGCRNQEGIAKLEQALAAAELNRDPELAGEARRSLVYFKLYLASGARDRESRTALIASAGADAKLWLSAIAPERAKASDLSDASGVCLELARALDGDLAGKRHYALEALRWHDLAERREEYSPAAGAELAGILEQLGVAEQDPGSKRELLYIAATLFLQDLEKEPDEAWLWLSWGVALSRLAQLPALAEREAVFLLARDVFLWEEAMRPGSEAYTIACIYALMGKFEDCRQWLERARAFKTLPSLLHMQTDADMDPVRGLPWFTEVLPEE